jgi:glycosyltransferase involved in cell wall biosynthesis
MYKKIKQILKAIYSPSPLITLKSKEDRGNVLISYIILPFTSNKDLSGHTNYWECKCMAETFVKAGYNVDIINWDNKHFIPRKKYKYFIDIHSNIERLVPYLNQDCIKIFHITGTHWLYQNHAEYSRLLQIQNRKGVSLRPRRTAPPTKGIELADLATMLGNEFTGSTYTFAKKEIYRIPLSTTHTFPFPENKNWTEAKKNFIYLGGAGMVHKGLDLVLEAFSQIPSCNLSIFSKKDDDFAELYYKELFETKNIKYFGHIDVGGPQFLKTMNESIGIISPSSSEGGSGNVIVSMHGGLIPIVSKEAAVDINDFGYLLNNNNSEEIVKVIRIIEGLDNKILEGKSRKAWEHVRAVHTRDAFKRNYKDFVEKLEKRAII